MRTAIIGLGNIGSRLATNLTAGGEDVIISERDLAKAEQMAAKLGSKAEAMAIEDALEAADLVILAIWFDAIKDFVAAHHSALAGKFIVDPSNPIAPDGKVALRRSFLRTSLRRKSSPGCFPRAQSSLKLLVR
jgi:8-hydroxy-5-deazaflavin:NADPH oxidoreductase